MSHFRSKQSRDRAQTQKAKTKSGGVTQVGKNYTQTTHTRISLWVSVVLVLAVAASVLIGLFGEHFPGLEILIEEPMPAEFLDEPAERQ